MVDPDKHDCELEECHDWGWPYGNDEVSFHKCKSCGYEEEC